MIPNPDHYYQLAQRKNDYEHGDLGAAVRFIVSQFNQGVVKNMLEIGCGAGDLASHFPEELVYMGIDPHEHSLWQSRQKHPHRQFIIGSADHLPFDDGSFDLIFSHQVLEMLTQPRRALKEMIRAVKPGGFVIIIAPNLEVPWSRFNGARHYTRWQWALLVARRFGDLGLRCIGISRFRILPQNYVEATGRFEKGDDDLKYITSAWEVAHFFTSRGFRIISAKKPTKKIVSILPPFRYYGGGMLFIFQKST